MKLSIDDLLARLPRSNDPSGQDRAVEALAHGTMSLKIVAPHGPQDRPPQAQDSVYVVVSGTSGLLVDGARTEVKPGDAVFVQAGQQHHFEGMSGDFVTWVCSFGPGGGEEAAPEISVFASVDA